MALRPGQILASRVETVYPDGRAVIFLAGRKVEAITAVPLLEGQEALLEVIGEQGGRLYLRLLSASGEGIFSRFGGSADPHSILGLLTKPETGSIFQQFLSSSFSFMSLWENMMNSASAAPSSSTFSPQVQFFCFWQEVFRGWWEEFFPFARASGEGEEGALRKLADFLPEMLKNKYFLLCLLTLLDMESSSPGGGTAWRRAAEPLLKDLAGQHIFNANVLGREQFGDYLYFSFPFLFPSGEGEIELRVYREALKRKNVLALGENIRIVLNIATQRLGKMQFIIHLAKEKNLEIGIRVEKEETLRSMEKSWPQMASELENMGFKVVLAELTHGRIEHLHPSLEEIKEKISASGFPVLCLDIIV